MNRLALLALFALACPLAACAGTDGDEEVQEEIGVADDAIVNGSKATGYPEAALVNMKKNGTVVAACSGAVIAPRVVLTAGHCVRGFTGWDVRTPYASAQSASSTSAATYDWTNTSQYVDPKQHDIGLVFLSKSIQLAMYPKIATAPVANGSQLINIGRINNGVFSSTNLYASQPVTVKSASSIGFPYDYAAVTVIESGDSGGPDIVPGTHTIAAVNSGSGGSTEVLARVDLVATWIQQQIASHGGTTP